MIQWDLNCDAQVYIFYRWTRNMIYLSNEYQTIFFNKLNYLMQEDVKEVNEDM